MEYRELPAPPPLDSLIHCFWFLRGGDDGSEPHTIVADGRIDVVLHLANPFARIDAAGVRHHQASVLIAGQLTEPIRVLPVGTADVVGIRFRTAAASAILRPRLAEFTNQVLPLGEIAPQFTRALIGAAARYDTPHERVAALSVVLTRYVRKMPDRLAHHAVRTLDSAAAPSVQMLSAEVGLSARTLERRVLDGTGLSPTELRKALRFRRAFRMLDQTPPGRWSTVALQAGYFDQAHLIRDFRQFAGTTPSQFFRADSALARAFIGDEDQG